MKIERISKIKNHKVFRDFPWPSSLNDFKDYNLIYGWNLSGKTTLANLFRAIEKLQPITEGELEIVYGGRKINSIDFSTAAVLPQVRVFSRDFVEEYVFTIHGSVSPIFFLGEESVKQQKEIDVLKSKLEEGVQKKLSGKQQEKLAEERELDNFCIDRGTIIRELLRSSGANPYNNYDKRSFKSKVDEIVRSDVSVKYVLSEEEKDRLKKQKDASAKDKVTTLTIKILDLNGVASDIKQLRARRVLSQVIDKLKNDQELSKWVKTGLEKHRKENSSICLFCEQPLPEGHLKRLDEHFNDEYNQFITDIDTKINELKQALEDASAVQMPDKAKLYDHLASSYQTACSKLKTQIAIYREVLGNLKDQLEDKKNKPFQELLFDVNLPDMDSSKVNVVNDIINQHNQETDDFQTIVANARKKIEESVVAEAVPVFLAKQGIIDELTRAYGVLQTEVADLKNKISHLEQQIVEHRRPAEELNKDLENYLGHNELKFEVKESGYLIKRNGQVADALSESEKTAIAFLYFLKSLNDKNFRLEKGVVVIDDPVSSLDANSLFNAFGYMKDRTKDAGQLFVLTHNFAFFRQVRNWFGYVNKRKKKLKKEATFFQLSCNCEEGRRCSKLNALDPLLSNYESDYHYLFSLIYQAAKQTGTTDGLNQYYNLPNIARRLLETFLAFRLPSTSGELYQKLERISFDPVKKNRIIRFLHTYSHYDQVSDSGHDISILSETPQVMSDVLGLIRDEDENHYKEMVALVDPSETEGEVTEL